MDKASVEKIGGILIEMEPASERCAVSAVSAIRRFLCALTKLLTNIKSSN